MILTGPILASLLATSPAPAPIVDSVMAERFASLALACIDKEYPNKLAHVLNGDEDVKPPRELTPAFFGCYDWHSAVHGHWLLQLAAELREWRSQEAQGWAAALSPLERLAAARIDEWLPKLTQPIRIGEHSQTAFSFGLILDWARTYWM